MLQQYLVNTDTSFYVKTMVFSVITLYGLVGGYCHIELPSSIFRVGVRQLVVTSRVGGQWGLGNWEIQAGLTVKEL